MRIFIVLLQRITTLFKNFKIETAVKGRLLVALLLVAGLLPLHATPSQAAGLNEPGQVDPTFQSGRGPNSDSIFSMELQKDGKILVVGGFTTYNDKARTKLVRLNPDGSVDSSFNPDLGTNRYIVAAAQQNDGKVVFAEHVWYNNIPMKRLSRLNADGSPDNSFNAGLGTTGFSPDVRVIKFQDDGKILVAGDFATYNGVSRNGIVRLNSDGSLDSSFDPGSGAEPGTRYLHTYVVSLIENKGKIIITGNFSSYNGTSRNGIARINSDGSLDTSFDPGSGSDYSISAAALQNDGKIIISGSFTTYNGTAVNRIARLNPDGSLDTSYNSGSGFDKFAVGIALQNDGKIVAVGDFTSYNGIPRKNVARLNPDGSLDTSFDPGSGVKHPEFTELVVVLVAAQSDGKILIGGIFISYNGVGVNQLARLNPNGSLDMDFNAGTGADNDIYALELQNDGKILIGGNFLFYNGASRKNIARLNADGSLDTSFNPGKGVNSNYNPPGNPPPDYVKAIKQLKDGKIMISGVEFKDYNGIAIENYARLNPDGSLDTSFNLNPAFYAVSSNTIEQQSDGKILIAQYSGMYNGSQRSGLARVNPDGSLDADFNPGLDAVNLALQSDGKILVTGNFTGTVTRLNADGTRDSSFNPGSGISSYTGNIAVKLQSDGKIIVAGGFTAFNNVPRKGIVRLNPDGSLDTSFDPGVSTDGQINTISLQSDGKVIIGGNFTSYDNVPRKNIARLNPDGSLDTSFNPGAGANYAVRASIIQSTDKVIIGGSFSAVDSYTRDRIARLSTTACNALVVTSATDDGQAVNCGTLSEALASTTNGDTISFALPAGNNVISFGGTSTPLLKSGVNLDGGAAGVILQGNGVNRDGLRLGGNNKLTNLTIRGFGGRELVIMPNATHNLFYRVKIES